LSEKATSVASTSVLIDFAPAHLARPFARYDTAHGGRILFHLQAFTAMRTRRNKTPDPESYLQSCSTTQKQEARNEQANKQKNDWDTFHQCALAAAKITDMKKSHRNDEPTEAEEKAVRRVQRLTKRR
jgi:hypothetical protein